MTCYEFYLLKMFKSVGFHFLLLFCGCFAQNYSVIPKWADFGFYGGWGYKDLDFKLEFTMDNYEIVSIEKCTGNGGATVFYFYIVHPVPPFYTFPNIQFHKNDKYF